MKKFYIGSLVGILFVLPSLVLAKQGVAQKLKGRILLQVESRGEAYYVDPVASERYYMENGAAAYSIMRGLGVGINNANLEKIKNDKTLALKHKGKIFLQVESRGEAYYVDFFGNLHYLKDGSEAYNIMRTLGLGITTKDLEQIPSKKLWVNVVKSTPENTKLSTSTTQTIISEQTPTRAPNQDWLDEQAELQKEFPIIVSLSDSKGNVNKSSNYNTQARSIEDPVTTLKVGNLITFTITAKEPKGRPLLYAWKSYLECKGVSSPGTKLTASDFTTNNTITCVITEADIKNSEPLNLIRIEGFIKSEKSTYRNPDGFDDLIDLKYNTSPLDNDSK